MNRILETLSKAEKNARDAIKPYPARAERFEPYSQSGSSPRGTFAGRSEHYVGGFSNR